MSHFQERFDIDIGQDEARRRFVNRTLNVVFDDLFDKLHHRHSNAVTNAIATALGERAIFRRIRFDYIGTNFLHVLRGVEAYNRVESTAQTQIDRVIRRLLSDSEIDLGITSSDGQFYPAGAALLDEATINDPSRWLRKNGHETVIAIREGPATLARGTQAARPSFRRSDGCRRGT